MGRSTPTTALVLCLYNVDTLNICMKEFGSIFFLQNDSYENLDNLSLVGLLYICIVCTFMGRSTPTTAFDGAI